MTYPQPLYADEATIALDKVAMYYPKVGKQMTEDLATLPASAGIKDRCHYAYGYAMSGLDDKCLTKGRSVMWPRFRRCTIWPNGIMLILVVCIIWGRTPPTGRSGKCACLERYHRKKWLTPLLRRRWISEHERYPIRPANWLYSCSLCIAASPALRSVRLNLAIGLVDLTADSRLA